MRILTGFAVLTDRTGDRITFTFDEVDEKGNVISDNNKKSYIAVDETTKAKIADLKILIETRMNE